MGSSPNLKRRVRWLLKPSHSEFLFQNLSLLLICLVNSIFTYDFLIHWTPMLIFRKEFWDYAKLCFKEFGDRVKYWVTLNKPLSYSQNGYANGRMAPDRCSAWINQNCTGGDSGTEPYLVIHYQLLAHAAADWVYKTKYQVCYFV